MKDRKRKKEKPRGRQPPAALSDAERSLWDILRDRQVAGARFKRRFPVGRLVVDFVCPERRLAVLLDGARHSERGDGRDQSLQARGYRVLRFGEEAVQRNPARVRAAIAALLERSDFAGGRDE